MVLLATLVLVMCCTLNAPFCRVADQFHNSVLNGAVGHIGVGYVWHSSEVYCFLLLHGDNLQLVVLCGTRSVLHLIYLLT